MVLYTVFSTNVLKQAQLSPLMHKNVQIELFPLMHRLPNLAKYLYPFLGIPSISSYGIHPQTSIRCLYSVSNQIKQEDHWALGRLFI